MEILRQLGLILFGFAGEIRPILLLFTGICIITTVITSAVTYATVRLLRRFLSGERGALFSR